MHRFYAPPSLCDQETVTLPEAEGHHAAKVLRLRPGDLITLLDGTGTEYTGKIQSVDRRRVLLDKIETKHHPPTPAEVVLLLGLPKAKAMDFIIQKATELGTTRIIPIQSHHSVIQIDPTDAVSKMEKWQTTAIEAMKQCASPWLPKIVPPLTVQQALNASPFDLEWIATFEKNARHPREVLQEFLSTTGGLPKSVGIWIGPEGDFSREEIDLILARNAAPVTLGPRILRAETAALYSLAILQYELSAPRRKP